MAVANGLAAVIKKIDSSEEQRSLQEERLATILEMGSNVLRHGRTPAQPTLTQSPTVISPTDNNNNKDNAHQPHQEPESVLEKQKAYRMTPKHFRLTEMYAEWVGEGDFHDEFGGIEGRNKKFGSQWRKHFPAHTYSRTERTIKGIRAYANENNMSAYDACECLQHQYEHKCKMSIAKLVDYFISMSWLKKQKPRGKVSQTL
ncbi:MAG: hypothetical protein ACRCZG_06290 [Culicoidibacterales bacterium]